MVRRYVLHTKASVLDDLYSNARPVPMVSASFKFPCANLARYYNAHGVRVVPVPELEVWLTCLSIW